MASPDADPDDGAKLALAVQQLQLQPRTTFHDGFLDALRAPFAAATDADGSSAWRRSTLQRFLASFFPAYQVPSAFAALWALLASDCAADSDAGDSREEDTLVVRFDALRDALRRHRDARLLAKDAFPLEREQLLDVTRTRRSVEELELPSLQPAPQSKRTSLPAHTQSAPPQVPSRQSVAVAGGSGRLLSPTDSSSSSNSSVHATATPLLLDFRAEVLKKSRNWLGRWQTRFLVLRWDELELCKKNVAAHRPAGAVAAQSPTASSSHSAAKSKRYPLHALLSLQLVALGGEGEPTRKQALSLHFQHAAPNGGHTSRALTLGSDSSEQLQRVTTQLATFALLAGLARGQDAAALLKFVHVGANLDVYCVVPPGLAGPTPTPPFALSPLQLAFLQGDDAAVQLLVRAGADPRSVLHWRFATHVLFPTAGRDRDGDRDSSTTRRRLGLLLRERVDGVVFPFGGVVADDAGQWSLLMYLCAVGELAAARELLATLRRLSPTKCRQYVEHVNAAGDNALHVAIKAAAAARASEELALLLVDVGTNHATLSASATTVSRSFVDAPLIHCSDGNGESVVHLALKGRLWRLVDRLVDCQAVDPTATDRHGNTSLHVAVKVGAPVPVVARLVQLYRPPRASAFSPRSSSRRATTPGFECRDRRGNDTPLTLALKRRQQEVVGLLLAAGASPDAGDCAWTTREPTALPAVGDGAIGDGDAPLHVAIKSGLSLAAASLVAHGADLLALDAHGASALALAIRFGMYALSVTIAQQLARDSDSDGDSRGLQQWIDLESGAPVTLLAMRAGQIELVAVLLDLCEDQLRLSHQVTKETLLHVLVKNMCWLELSEDAAVQSDDADADADERDKQQFYRDMLSPTKRQRRRLKSRSEGDLRHLRLSPLLTAAPAPASQPAKTTAPSSERTAVAVAERQQLSRAIAFFQDAEEAIIRGALQRSSDVTSVSVASVGERPHTTFHLATAPSFVVTDQSSDAYAPLHAAAAGGDATRRVLSLLLAFLFLRCPSPSRLEVAQALATTTGRSAETPLHAALAANAPGNALQILFAVRVASGAQRFAPLTRNSVGAEAVTTAQVTALCARVVEAATAPSGSTPLHLACLWPQSADMLRVAELLLQEGAYAGSWDADGLAPLHVALQRDCDERVIRLFQRHGQDLNAWTEGAAASVASRRNGSRSEWRVADDSSDLDAEQREAADWSATPKTALMLALEHENTVAWRELVRCGAQVRVLTPKTRLGLLHAAVECHVRDTELLRALLGCRQLVAHDVTDYYGRTTADVAQRLEAQLQLADEQPSLLPSPPDVAGLVRRRTSAVLEEQDNDDAASDSLSAQEPATTVSPSVSISYSLPPSGDTRRVSSSSSSSGIVFKDVGARQQPLTSSHSVALEADVSAVSHSVAVARATGAVGSPSRAPSPSPLGTARGLQSLPPAPSLDSAVVAFLREEERATLTLVAHEARQEARDWLKKRIGQKKLLSDARAQLQSAMTHRRTGSGSVPAPATKAPPDGDSSASSRESERQLAQYKALAAKKFVDKHVAEAVAEARLDIEREKQAIFQDTGVYPGRSATRTAAVGGVGGFRRGERLHRTASSASSARTGGHQRSDSNATLLSDESAASVWWSEHGESSFDDLGGTWLSAAGGGGGRGGTMLSDNWNGTWLSSLRGTGVEYRDTHLSSSTFLSFVESAGASDPYAGVDGVPGSLLSAAAVGVAHKGGDDARNDDDDDDWDDDYTNPLDRDSFAHVIETRKSLS